MKIFLKTLWIFLKLKYEEVFKDFLFPFCKTVLQIVAVIAFFVFVVGIIVVGIGYLAIGVTKFISPSFLAQWVSFAVSGQFFDSCFFDSCRILPRHFFMAMLLGMHTLMVIIWLVLIAIGTTGTVKFLRKNWIKARDMVKAQIKV